MAGTRGYRLTVGMKLEITKHTKSERSLTCISWLSSPWALVRVFEGFVVLVVKYRSARRSDITFNPVSNRGQPLPLEIFAEDFGVAAIGLVGRESWSGED